MKTRIGTLAVLTAVLACAPAYAVPIKAKVRVEGATKTLFEGTVTTDAHDLNKDSTGPHKCDGTNGGANTTAGPTMAAALDDATKAGGIDWTASWNDGFQDFFVNGIGPDTSSSSNFWGYALNGAVADQGGCQELIQPGDEVLYYYGGTFKRILRASGPRKVRAGRLLRLKVTAFTTTFDASGKPSTSVSPVSGATIGGRRTNSSGIAKLRFRAPGVKRLKARKAESVRSNQLRVKVLRRR